MGRLYCLVCIADVVLKRLDLSIPLCGHTEHSGIRSGAVIRSGLRLGLVNLSLTVTYYLILGNLDLVLIVMSLLLGVNQLFKFVLVGLVSHLLLDEGQILP